MSETVKPEIVYIGKKKFMQLYENIDEVLLLKDFNKKYLGKDDSNIYLTKTWEILPDWGAWSVFSVPNDRILITDRVQRSIIIGEIGNPHVAMRNVLYIIDNKKVLLGDKEQLDRAIDELPIYTINGTDINYSLRGSFTIGSTYLDPYREVLYQIEYEGQAYGFECNRGKLILMNGKTIGCKYKNLVYTEYSYMSNWRSLLATMLLSHPSYAKKETIDNLLSNLSFLHIYRVGRNE